MFAFLLGNTAPHSENQVRIAILEWLEPAQVAVSLANGLVAHCAGVEQDQAGLVGLSYLVVADTAEQVDNPLRVNHVHLTAKGF